MRITAENKALENIEGAEQSGIGNKIEIPFFHTFLENEWSGRSERRPSWSFCCQHTVHRSSSSRSSSTRENAVLGTLTFKKPVARFSCFVREASESGHTPHILQLWAVSKSLLYLFQTCLAEEMHWRNNPGHWGKLKDRLKLFNKGEQLTNLIYRSGFRLGGFQTPPGIKLTM